MAKADSGFAEVVEKLQGRWRGTKVVLIEVGPVGRKLFD